MKFLKAKCLLLIILISTISYSFLFSQNLLNQPESVEWNHFTEQWLVSNHATGEIVAINETGEQTIFSDSLSSTRGLKVYQDKLYAASNDGLAIFDLENQTLDELIPVTEAVLLNDLDFSNDSTLFISDYWDNKIFKIDLTDFSYEIYIEFTNFAPNGLIFDEENNRMIACGHNGQTSVIYSFDVNSGESELLLYPNIYSLDGFAKDSEGNIYISSWYTDAVYRYEGNNINNNVTIAAQGLNDPADIFIHNDILAVPNFSIDSVSIIPLTINSIENSNFPVNFNLTNYPNPFNPITNIHFSLPSSGKIDLSIYNMYGQKVKILIDEIYPQGEHSVKWNGKNESGNKLPTGVYFYKIISGNNYQVKRMLLLK